MSSSDLPEYVQNSRLEITVLRPGKTVVTLAVETLDEWEALWLLERPRFVEAGRPIPAAARVATAFKLAFVSAPGGRRAQVTDLTTERAIEAARAEVEGALGDTAADRQRLDVNMTNRGGKKLDNQLHGTDRNRGRD